MNHACSACGAENPANARACAACKAILRPRCPSCEKLLPVRAERGDLCAACKGARVTPRTDDGPTDKNAAASHKHAAAHEKPATASHKPAAAPHKHAAASHKHPPAHEKPAPSPEKHAASPGKHAPAPEKHPPSSEKHAASPGKHAPAPEKHPPSSEKHPPSSDKHGAAHEKPAAAHEKKAATPPPHPPAREGSSSGARRAPPPPLPGSTAAAPAVVAAAPPVPESSEMTLAARFVGRRDLVRQLARLLDRAGSEREVHFAALTGPSGIGKTRLVRELAKAVHATAAKACVLVATCDDPASPPFSVFGRLFADRFGIAADTTVERARSKIAGIVSQALPAGRGVEVTRLLAQLACGLPPDEPALKLHADRPERADRSERSERMDRSDRMERSDQQEARMFIAVRRFLAADADRHPLLLIFDDADRASPETIKLLQYLAVGLEGHPVVLLAVARPELYAIHPQFGEGAALERLEVGALTRDESAELFDELVRPAGEPPLALARHARESLGGSPRALYELARYLLESGGIRRVGRGYAFERMRFAPEPLPSAAPPLALPGTLHELVAARFASLAAPERDLLEKAAACGESFWIDAVVALVRAESLAEERWLDGPTLDEVSAGGERTREEVAAMLHKLEERGIVTGLARSRIPGMVEYRFAYPPWCEVIASRIAAPTARRYHAVIAQWLEVSPAASTDGAGDSAADGTLSDEVARHLELAGDGDAAARRYRLAADVARARYYNSRAIRLYQKALACTSARELASRIQLWHDLGSVQQLTGEHDAARRAFDRMYRLAWVVASRAKAAVALNKIGRIDRQRGELAPALGFFERGLDLFRLAGDERGVAGSLDDIAQVLWLLGRYDEALDRGARGLERRRRLGDRRSVALSLLTIGHIERHRGRFKEAETYYHEALTIRREMDDPAGIAATLNGFGALAFQRGDYEAARGSWEEALGLAEEIGALPQMAVIEDHLGEVARALGNLAEARTRFERCEAAARELDDKRLLSEALRNLGGIELASGGSIERAMELCTRAFELADRAGIRVDAGRALVSIGEVHAQTLFSDRSDGNSPAEDYFQRAVDIFREIGNEAELGVALERLGSHRVERGQTDAGKKLLAEANAIFTRLGMQVFGRNVRQMMTELG